MEQTIGGVDEDCGGVVGVEGRMGWMGVIVRVNSERVLMGSWPLLRNNKHELYSSYSLVTQIYYQMKHDVMTNEVVNHIKMSVGEDDRK